MGPVAPEDAVTTGLRRFLLAIVTVGVIGTLAELYLLEHYTVAWQVVPMALLVLSVPPLIACWIRPVASAVRALQVLMLGCVVAGAIGVQRHYASNQEFELEIFPDKAGLELIWSSLEGAVPALAPGMLLLLGLVGLAWAYRHPATTPPASPES